ncbi:hypothetical protein CCYA_CCYA13G3493 [Cyanidiococcus yangmingshanensis]|nr:hypothetical protein CCYA_CCYA13G3493 [Cyanidiococcus yangmingshanensis]
MPVISLGRIDNAHQNGVWALSGLANGCFVSGGLDGALRLWRLSTREPNSGSDVPDASIDDAETVHDEQTTNKIAEMTRAWPEAHRLAITSVASAPKHDTCVSTGFDGRIRIWTLDTREEERSNALEIQLNPLEAFQVAMTTDATQVAAGGDVYAGAPRPGVACVASLFSVPSTERLQSFEIEPASRLENYRFTMCMRFVGTDETGSRSGALVCGGNDGSIVRADLETRNWDRFVLNARGAGKTAPTTASGLPIRALAQANREEDVVFCASEDECVHVVDWRMREQASLLGTAGSGPLFATAIAEDNTMLVFAAGADGRVRAYDRRTGECVYTRGGDASKTIWALESMGGLYVDSHRILCGGDDGYIEVLKT